jgi:chromosome segregation ATPase
MQQEAAQTRIVQTEERRANRAEKDLEDAKHELDEVKLELKDLKKTWTVLDDRLASLQAELGSTKRQLEDAQQPVREEEINTLKERIRELESANNGLIESAKNINNRYKEGDLVSSSFSNLLYHPLTFDIRVERRREIIRQLSDSDVTIDTRRSAHREEQRTAEGLYFR